MCQEWAASLRERQNRGMNYLLVACPPPSPFTISDRRAWRRRRVRDIALLRSLWRGANLVAYGTPDSSDLDCILCDGISRKVIPFLDVTRALPAARFDFLELNGYDIGRDMGRRSPAMLSRAPHASRDEIRGLLRERLRRFRLALSFGC